MSTIAVASMSNDSPGAVRDGAEAIDRSQPDVQSLFGEHGGALYRFCRFTLGRDDEAEDVVQDTFLKLIVHLGREGDRSNLRAWLFAVAANGCRDRLRARRRWLPWVLESDLRAVVPDDEQPDRVSAGTAFRALAPRDRLLLALRAHGFSYREIAAASGIRYASVGRLLARAVERWKRTVAPASRAGDDEEEG